MLLQVYYYPNLRLLLFLFCIVSHYFPLKRSEPCKRRVNNRTFCSLIAFCARIYMHSNPGSNRCRSPRWKGPFFSRGISRVPGSLLGEGSPGAGLGLIQGLGNVSSITRPTKPFNSGGWKAGLPWESISRTVAPCELRPKEVLFSAKTLAFFRSMRDTIRVVVGGVKGLRRAWR